MSTEVKKDKPNYFISVKSEIKKVSWPTRAEVLNYTGIVLAMCVFFSVLLGVFDLVFKFGFSFLL